MLSSARLEAAFRRPDGLDALELLGLAAVAALLVAGSVAMPRATLLLALAAVALVFLVTRIDLAILLVVATAPLEGAFASGPAGISVTKFAGYICIAAFVYALAKDGLFPKAFARVHLEPGETRAVPLEVRPARGHGLSYNQFIAGCRKAEIELDRKVLADLAVSDPAAFAVVAEQAKAALQA